MKRILKSIFTILKVFAIFLAIIIILFLTMILFKEEDKKLITESFVDFEQIDGITKFRSCYGHDSGRILNKKEPPSSLKHYVIPKDEYVKTEDKVKIFAPFDGKVLWVGTMHADRGVHLILLPRKSLWGLGFDHINLKEGIGRGYKFSAGDLLGYASTGDDEEYPGSFDVELGYLPQIDSGSDSAFNHMTEEVLQQFEEYGLSQNEMVITMEEREKDPCECVQMGESDCVFRPENTYPDQAVKLTTGSD